MWICLFAYASMSFSWVIKMIVVPSLLSSIKRFITSSHVTLSSAPVGSSARIISGFTARALAIETLCCCPPESSFGLL